VPTSGGRNDPISFHIAQGRYQVVKNQGILPQVIFDFVEIGFHKFACVVYIYDLGALHEPLSQSFFEVLYEMNRSIDVFIHPYFQTRAKPSWYQVLLPRTISDSTMPTTKFGSTMGHSTGEDTK
jgi:hypothetical protein